MTNANLVRGWNDSIYIASDPALSGDDSLLKRVWHSGGLAAFGRYTETVTAQFPGVVTGDYYVILVVDSRVTIPDPDRSNNSAVASTQVSVTIPQLIFDTQETGTLRSGRDVYYRLDMPAGSDALVTAGLAGPWQGELYLRYGQVPDRTNFDFRAKSFSAAQQRLLLTNAPGGTWYVLLYGLANASSGQPFTLLAESRPFMLFDATPDQGGNAGRVTINVTGVGFSPSTSISLQDGGGSSVGSVSNISFVDGYHLLATLDLTGVLTGTYSLHASDAGGSDTLVDSFTVITGIGPKLSANIVLPGSARPGRQFQGQVVFSNDGDANLPIPLMRLQAPPGGSLWSTNQQAAEAHDSLQFVAIPTDAYSGGVLAPGQRGTFTYWATIPATGSTTFSLTLRTTTDVTPFDYTSLKNQIRPANPPALWDAAFDAMVTGIGGNTYGAYVTALVAAADEAHGYGLALQSVRDLLDYMVDRANLGLPADIRGTVHISATGVTQPVQRGIISLLPSFDVGDTSQSATTRTWYDGSYALRNVPNGTYALQVAGYYSPSINAITFSGTPITGLDVIVNPGGVVQGTVRDDAFWWSHVSGATVIAADANGQPLATAQTDVWGRYTLGGLPLNQPLVLSAGHPEHVPAAPVTMTLTSAGTLLQDFTLGQGGSVSGTVYDPLGAPVANARVSARSDEGSFGRVVTTDAVGNYRILGLVTANYSLAAYSPGYALGITNNVSIIDGLTITQQDISLRNGGTIDASMTDADAGTALAGATVAPLTEASAYQLFVTDAMGQVSVTDQPPGQAVVYVGAPGYIPQVFTVTVTAGTSIPLNASLRPAGTVNGGVSRAGGSPLAGAPVSIVSADTMPETVRTNAAGQFGFSNALDGDYFVYIGDGVAPTVSRQDFTLGMSGNDTVLTITLDYAEVSGTLLDTNGTTPIPDANILLIRGSQVVESMKTAADGKFRFWVFEAGNFDLAASHPSIGLQSLTGLTVSPGTDLSNQNIVISGGEVTVDVVDSLSTPLANAPVILEAQGGLSALSVYAATDISGTATFAHLPAGNYDVRVNQEGFAATKTSIVHGTGNDNFVVTLGAGRTVTGTILTSSGSPVESVQLIFDNQGTGQSITAITGQGGVYLLDRLVEGSYNVLVTDPAGRVRPLLLNNVTFSGPGPFNLDVTVSTSGATLSGQVTDGTGAPVRQATVTLLDANHQVMLASRTENDGTYAITRVPTGTVTVRVTSPGYLPVTGMVSLPAVGLLVYDPSLGPVQALAMADQPATVSRMRSAVRGPTNNHGFSSLEAWKTGGLQPPQKPDFLNNYNLPQIPADAPPEVHSAWVETLLARDRAQEQFSAWQDSYTSAVQLGLANKGIIGSQSAILSSKLAAMTVMLAQMSGVAGLESAALGLELSGTFATASSILTNFEQGLQDPNNIDWITGASDAWSVASKKLFKELMDQGLNIPGDMLDIANDIRLISQSIETLHQDEAGAKARYNQSEDQLQKTVLDLYRRDAKLRSLLNEENNNDSGKPVEEPPNPPNNEENSLDQQQTQRRASKDPNDITGPAGVGPERWLPVNTEMTYTIQFENVPTATAPAQEAWITHTLDANLDWSTFELGNFGFGQWDMKVPQRRQAFFTRMDLISELGFYVDVAADFDITTGTATWHFIAIDPGTGDLISDPDAGFLAPNITKPEGEGYVEYRVRPRSDSSTGTTIPARASIVFDLNETIQTPEYVNTVDADAPSSQVLPLPATSTPRFMVRWSGDDGVGVGIAAYDIYVSEDGGDFTPWLSGTMDTVALFNGNHDSLYAFYTVAVDLVGNREAPPASADTSTEASEDYKLYVPTVLISPGG